MRSELPSPSIRTRFLGICAGLLLPLIFGAPDRGAAQEMSEVTSGRRVEITAHGVCRRVHNGTENAVMIPTRSPEEWAVGGSAFLTNVPTNMTAYACVSPEIALRRWSRPGPLGSTGQPFTINGADHGLTFTSVGTSTDGVSPALVGNEVTYTPDPASWRLEDLATQIYTVPFEGIDSEGVAVQGNLRITLVGYDGLHSYLAFRYYQPGYGNVVYGDLGADVPYLAGPGAQINMIFQVSQNIFDGQVSFAGLMSVKFGSAQVLVIDNSSASMGAYSGPTVGDVNGDGSANTILDAQIKAGLDFVDLMIANRQKEVGFTRLEGLTDPTGFMQNSVYGEGNVGPNGSTDSGVDPIFFYTAGATGGFVGETDVATYSSYRSSARSALLSIRRVVTTLNTSQVFTYLDGEIARLAPSHFTMTVHLLSPGANSGATPNLSRFNQTGSGQLGTPVFAYYTGGNAASAQATFMAGLDHAGTRRHMTSPSVFGAATPPSPVFPDFNLAHWVNGAWEPIRNADGTVHYPQIIQTNLRRMYAFGFRVLPGTDTTCYATSCQMADVPTSLIRNYSGILTLSGQVNTFQMQPIMFTNPIYRVHNDNNATNFNLGGVIWGRNFSVRGGYTPLPPN